MTEASSGARLAQETLAIIGLRSDVVVQNFERDFTLELRVRGSVDGCHTAMAKLLVQEIVIDLLILRHTRQLNSSACEPRLTPARAGASSAATFAPLARDLGALGARQTRADGL